MAVDCPVCYEELDGKVTHTLPCQHVFCDSCMDQMVTTRGAKRKIKCAMCRERHVYQEDGSLKKGMYSTTAIVQCTQVTLQFAPLNESNFLIMCFLKKIHAFILKKI